MGRGQLFQATNRLSLSPVMALEARVFLAGEHGQKASLSFGSLAEIAGGSLATADGRGMIRGHADGTTPVAIVPGKVYAGNQLDVFRRPTAAVKPGSPGQEHVGSNPWRTDGTAHSFGLIPQDFSGRLPVYTLGNHWPTIGPAQRPPSFSNGLDHDTGLLFSNGQAVAESRPLTVPGAKGAILVNETNKSYFITAGVFPGSEQPGQAITLSNPGSTVEAPIPPQGWWNYADPKVYASVAGLHPVDGIGWHESRAFPSPSEGFGPNAQDFGTPGFAYLVTNKYTANGNLFGSLTQNEGYDPAIAGDPEYGVALELVQADGRRELIGVQDIQLVGAGEAKHQLWANSRYNPGITAQGRLAAYPVAMPGESFVYRLISHPEAQRLLQNQNPAQVLTNMIKTA